MPNTYKASYVNRIGDQAGKLILWEIATGREVWTAQAGKAIVDLSFFPDGRYIHALIRGDQGVYTFDPVTGKKTGKIPLSFTPNYGLG